MKKILSLAFVVIMLFSLCACNKGSDTEASTTQEKNYYEMSLYGEWKRQNSDIVIMLTSGNYGTQKQKGLTVSIYWEADANTILLKTNMVGETKALPYTLDSKTLVIHNLDGSKTIYTRLD